MNDVRDLLIVKTARELDFPEVWVEKVISHQFKSATQAMHTNSSIEISGFGKFLISQPKIRGKIDHHQKIQEAILSHWEEYSDTVRESKQRKLDNLKKDLLFYHKHLLPYEAKDLSNSGGDTQSPPTTQGT